MRTADHPTAAIGAARLAVLVGIVVLWWAVSAAGLLSSALLPDPLAVARSAVGLLIEPKFWGALGHTAGNALLGLALGVAVGLPLGLLLGLAPQLERMTRLLMDIGRSFPVIALLPVLILIFGATSRMETIVIFLGVLWPILLQTIYGARRLDPVVRDTVRAFRIPVGLRFISVLLPSAAPFAATGIRVAASASILLSIAVEVLGKTPGLGFELVRAQSGGRADLAFAYIFICGVLGVLLNAVLSAVEQRLLAWNRRGEPAAAR